MSRTPVLDVHAPADMVDAGLCMLQAEGQTTPQPWRPSLLLSACQLQRAQSLEAITAAIGMSAAKRSVPGGHDCCHRRVSCTLLKPLLQVTVLHSTLSKPRRNDGSCILQVEGPHHPSALEAFPAAAGVADVNHGKGPGAGIGGDQRWQAPQEPAVPVKGEAFRKVEWSRESRCWLAATPFCSQHPCIALQHLYLAQNQEGFLLGAALS